MSYDKPIRRIAIVGTGVIGASWTAPVSRQGIGRRRDRHRAERRSRAEKVRGDRVAGARAIRPIARRVAVESQIYGRPRGSGLPTPTSSRRTGPNGIDFKQKLYGQLDELLPPDAIIASSSSGLKMSDIQSGAASHPERCVIAHPFNPPHLIPLVEMVGGAKTSEATIRRAAECLYVDRQADGAPEQGNAGARRQSSAGRAGARGLLPRCRGVVERR